MYLQVEIVKMTKQTKIHTEIEKKTKNVFFLLSATISSFSFYHGPLP